jgi:hypothetical protein
VWSKGVVYTFEDREDVFRELETKTLNPIVQEMLLVAVNYRAAAGGLGITKRVVDVRGEGAVDDDDKHRGRRSERQEEEAAAAAEEGEGENSSEFKGFVVENQLRSLSMVAEEMDQMNPRGSYAMHASITVKNSAPLNLKILDLLAEEVAGIQDASGVHCSLVFNPLTISTQRIMARRGGNAIGIRPEDGPLTGEFY